ncbi:hypothetical protein V6N12_019440 [Hibiscus sabdariffa]|uniref:Uncharacterized protein n=1 Tax=Hibiscus sabdariffa TaxID=183260 RepID=A0ABR2BM95_9ROSI
MMKGVAKVVDVIGSYSWVLGDENDIVSFWEDIWLDNVPLKDTFPRLFMLAVDRIKQLLIVAMIYNVKRDAMFFEDLFGCSNMG